MPLWTSENASIKTNLENDNMHLTLNTSHKNRGFNEDKSGIKLRNAKY